MRVRERLRCSMPMSPQSAPTRLFYRGYWLAQVSTGRAQTWLRRCVRTYHGRRGCDRRRDELNDGWPCARTCQEVSCPNSEVPRCRGAVRPLGPRPRWGHRSSTESIEVRDHLVSARWRRVTDADGIGILGVPGWRDSGGAAFQVRRRLDALPCACCVIPSRVRTVSLCRRCWIWIWSFTVHVFYTHDEIAQYKWF
jgi:hypothetical protein